MRVVSEAAEAGRVNPVALVQLDLSKAFDRVHRKCLSALLHYFGVGETIEEWVSICYRDNYTRLLVNGVPGAAINIEHSVKQGCPLSPALFSLYLEPLCRSLLADDIPLQMTMLGIPVLISVPGRLPRCLRCNKPGHTKRECQAP